MSEFRYDVTEINEIINSYLPDVRGFQTTVQKAMNEAVRNGGKRIRPIIMYESCRMFAETCGEEKESWISDIAPFMAAIEMIHSFSLIHDDLPCMDNDTLRRGMPTTWYTYGEAMGVPPCFSAHLETFHGLVAIEGVLDGTSQHVVNAGMAVG